MVFSVNRICWNHKIQLVCKECASTYDYHKFIMISFQIYAACWLRCWQTHITVFFLFLRLLTFNHISLAYLVFKTRWLFINSRALQYKLIVHNGFSVEEKRLFSSSVIFSNFWRWESLTTFRFSCKVMNWTFLLSQNNFVWKYAAFLTTEIIIHLSLFGLFF